MVTRKKYAQKALIILMMLFLCVPCTIKRDAKQNLGIPVAQEKNTKSNTVTSCIFVHNNTSDSQNQATKKQTLQKVFTASPAPLIYATFNVHYRQAVGQRFFVAPIPIYIQQQQYLI